MELKHNILKYLIEHKDNTYSIRELSHILQVDYKNVYMAVQRIRESIVLQKKSNACFISFKPLCSVDVYSVEQKRKEEIQHKIPLVYKDITAYNNPFFVPILFGSYAKKNANKNSDIDICIIHNNDIDALLQTLSVHPNIDIYNFSLSEFINMLNAPDFNVIKEIVSHGIALKNIELYYEIIKNGSYSYKRSKV